MGRMALAVLLAVIVLGCESDNRIQIENASTTQLRVMLSVPGGGVSTVTPVPGSAASVVVTIPVVIIVLLFQRRIVAGLTAGAVKG